MAFPIAPKRAIAQRETVNTRCLISWCFEEKNLLSKKSGHSSLPSEQSSIPSEMYDSGTEIGSGEEQLYRKRQQNFGPLSSQSGYPEHGSRLGHSLSSEPSAQSG